MASSSTVYLISGANRARSIGFGLAAHILATHESAFVYAGAQNPEKASALEELKLKYPACISIIKCVSGDPVGNVAMAKEIEECHGCVDTVIACAGTGEAFSNVASVSISNMEEHFHVNVMGPVVLFQSMFSLLKKSAKPRFVPISSIAGCITGGFIQLPMESICYGSTKAALNWVTRKIHFENNWLIAFPLSPGGVDTDMLDNTIAKDKTNTFKTLLTGKEPTAEEAAVSLLKVIDKSTREKEGGEFMHLDGTKVPFW